MACLFSLSTRANIVRRRYNASFSYVLNDDRKHNSIDEGPSLEGMGNLFQQKSFGSSSNRFNNSNDSAVFGFFHNRRCSDTGVSFCRHMSTKIGAASEKIEFINDVADVITDRTVEAVAAQAPAMDEVLLLLPILTFLLLLSSMLLMQCILSSVSTGAGLFGSAC